MARGQHPLDGNTVALWRLNDSGAAAIDAAGALNLTYYGGAIRAPGLGGDYARYLNGSSSAAIHAAGAPALGTALQGEFTIEAWALMASDNATGGEVFAYQGRNGGESIAVLGVSGARQPYVNTYSNGAGAQRLWPGVTVPTGEWFHIAASRAHEGGNLWTWRGYLNGVLRYTVTGLVGWAPLQAVTADRHIACVGSYAGGASIGNAANAWRGWIADVRISNVARTAESMLAIYSEGTTAAPVVIPDTTAPTFSLVTPAEGPISAVETIGVGTAGDAKRAIYFADLLGRSELVFDGTTFGPGYSGGTDTGGPGTFSIFVSRADGWAGPVTLRGIAYDAAGNETVQTWAFTAPAPPVVPADSTPPTLDFFPPAGTSIGAADHIAALASGIGELNDLVVTAEVDGRTELAFNGTFAPGYAAGSTVTESDPGEWVLSVRRDAGWVGPVTLRSVAYDDAGNRAQLSVSVTAPAPPPPPAPDTAEPTVELISPADGANITPDTPIELDVLDNVELRRVFVAVEYPKTGFVELAFDGSSFSSTFGGASTRTPVAGGARFKLIRSGGWPSAPTVRAYPRDAAGNE